jgi:hypothetical protein
MAETIYLADVRYSMSVPANSSAALRRAADDYGIRRVIVEPIYSPGNNPKEAGIFFASLFCQEVAALRELSVMEWLTTLSRKHSLPRVDSLDDLLAVPNINEIWLRLTLPPEQFDDFATILVEDFPEEEKIVLAADFPLPEGLPYKCADPTGKHDFFITTGSLKQRIRHPILWPKSVAFRSDGYSVIRTQAIV